MVVTIESKVIINGKFYATGALSLLHKTFTTQEQKIVILNGILSCGKVN